VKKHVVLIGLPGAGKSAVGRVVAAELRAEFEDLDDAIVAAAGRPIPAIFTEAGEPAFRDLERTAMARALARPPHVIAAGGGWAAQPGNFEAAEALAVVIHLACAPETAAARVADGHDRPLLSGDRVAALRRLHAERAASYARAERAVNTDGCTPAEVAHEVVQLARSLGGW
jgi:shikimate kinase